jgi:hypothetical protein
MAVGDLSDRIASRLGLGSEIDRREHAALEAPPREPSLLSLIFRATAEALLFGMSMWLLFGADRRPVSTVASLAIAYAVVLFLVGYAARLWRGRHQGCDAG